MAGEVIVQGTIPSTEFNNKAIYYQVGGSLKVTRGNKTIEIANEWYTELNDVAGSGAITAVEITDGYLTDDTVTDPANTGLTGTWVTKNEQWSFSFTIDTALMNSGSSIKHQEQTPIHILTCKRSIFMLQLLIALVT